MFCRKLLFNFLCLLFGFLIFSNFSFRSCQASEKFGSEADHTEPRNSPDEASEETSQEDDIYVQDDVEVEETHDNRYKDIHRNDKNAHAQEGDHYFTPSPAQSTRTSCKAEGAPQQHNGAGYCNGAGGNNEDSKFMVLLSTLDGNVVALDVAEGGREAWSLMTDKQPLLSSTLKNTELYPTMDYRLIPSMDGSLYYYQHGILQPMPMNADALLSGTMQVGFDAVSGGKHVLTYGVNAYSGKIHYSCSMNGCVNSDQRNFFKDNLVVRRRTQTVRAVDITTGEERWNVTMGEHELLFTEESMRTHDHWHNKGCESTGQSESYDSKFWKVFHSVEIVIDPPSGIVRAIDLDQDELEPLWTVKLRSPVAQAWQIKYGQLELLSLFDPRVVPTLEFLEDHYFPMGRNDAENALAVKERSLIEDSLLYFGTYNKDLYVIPSPQERQKLQRLALTVTAAGLRASDNSRHLDRIEDNSNYRQGLESDEAGKPSNALVLKDDYDRSLYVSSYKKPSKYAITIDIQEEAGCPDHYQECYENSQMCSTVEFKSYLLREDHPVNDKGWYLFKHRNPEIAGNDNVDHKWTKFRDKKDKLKNSIVSSGLIEVLWNWWKALGLIFVSSMCTIFALKHYGLVHFGQNTEPESLASKQICVQSTSDASGQTALTNVSDASGGTTPPGLIPEIRKSETGSQASFPEQESPTMVQEEFSSRYLNDFEALRCLGKGGFGIVFKSRNKMDDVEYAVKRIAVANSECAREKVVREVKMLAKLDHPGIVRYFNSWIECPPCNWQEKTDRELLEKCGGVQKSITASDFDPTSFASSLAPSDWPSKSLRNRSPNGLVTSFTIDPNDVMNGNLAINTDNDSLARELDRNLFKFGLDSTANESVNFSMGNSVNFSENEESGLLNEPSRNDDNGRLKNWTAAKEDSNDSLVIKFQRTKSVDKELQAGPPGFYRQISHLKNKETGLNTSTVSSLGKEPTKMYLYIQMQLCKERTLRDFLLSHNSPGKSPPRGLLLDWFAQILVAVEYVHDCGLIHRDLKPSNIFFSQTGQIKVGDFGLATAILDEDADCELSDENSNISVESDKLNEKLNDSGIVSPMNRRMNKRNNRLTGQVGTQLYMSPEQLSGQTYNSKVDIFSLGLILLELLIPFGTQMERVKTLQGLRCQKLPLDFKQQNPAESDFALWLTTIDPENRPTATEIRESDFFQDEIVEKGYYSAYIPSLKGLSKRDRSRTTSGHSNSSNKTGFELLNGSERGSGDTDMIPPFDCCSQSSSTDENVLDW